MDGPATMRVAGPFAWLAGSDARFGTGTHCVGMASREVQGARQVRIFSLYLLPTI